MSDKKRGNLSYKKWLERNKELYKKEHKLYVDRKKVTDLFNSLEIISNFVYEDSEWKDDVSFKNSLADLYSSISLFSDSIEDKYEEEV